MTLTFLTLLQAYPAENTIAFFKFVYFIAFLMVIVMVLIGINDIYPDKINETKKQIKDAIRRKKMKDTL